MTEATVLLRCALGAEARVALDRARAASAAIDRIFDGDGGGGGGGPEVPIPVPMGPEALGELAAMIAASPDGARAYDGPARWAAVVGVERERPRCEREDFFDNHPDGLAALRADLARDGERRARAAAALLDAVRLAPPATLDEGLALRVAAAADFLEAPAILAAAAEAVAARMEGRTRAEAREVLERSGATVGLLVEVGEAVASGVARAAVRELLDGCVGPAAPAGAGRASFHALRRELGRLLPAQRAAMSRILEGRNAFVTGPAGSGKSHVLEAAKRIVPLFDAALGARRARERVAVVAPTASAAILVGGSTIHSRFRIDPHAEGVDVEAMRTALEVASARGEGVGRLLAIDEVSMVAAPLLDAVDRGLRATFARDLPFGGRQVVLFGDLLQLPPIDPGAGDADARLVTEAAAYAAGGFETIALDRSVRHGDDGALAASLDALRIGGWTPEACRLLASRAGAAPPDDGILPTHLYLRNADVDRMNERELRALPEEGGRTYRAVDSREGRLTAADEARVAACRLPEALELRVGAQVVFTTNDSSQCWGKPRPSAWVVRNGTRGVVERCDPDGPIVRIAGGVIVPVEPIVQTIVSRQRSEPVPCLRHDRVACAACPFSGLRSVVEASASRAQIPLALAWATTVHRSQGATLDRARVSLPAPPPGRRASPGIAYVALSRVRSADALYLDEFDPSCLRAHAAAVAFYGGAAALAEGAGARRCRCGAPAACRLDAAGGAVLGCGGPGGAAGCDLAEPVPGARFAAPVFCRCRPPRAVPVRVAGPKARNPGRAFRSCDACRFFEWAAGEKRARCAAA